MVLYIILYVVHFGLCWSLEVLFLLVWSMYILKTLTFFLAGMLFYVGDASVWRFLCVLVFIVVLGGEE
jgi:hypothetical protein